MADLDPVEMRRRAARFENRAIGMRPGATRVAAAQKEHQQDDAEARVRALWCRRLLRTRGVRCRATRGGRHDLVRRCLHLRWGLFVACFFSTWVLCRMAALGDKALGERDLFDRLEDS